MEVEVAIQSPIINPTSNIRQPDTSRARDDADTEQHIAHAQDHEALRSMAGSRQLMQKLRVGL